MQDLVSAGFEGLVHAYTRFDASRNESFEAYIDHRIRGAILDQLRALDPLTREQRAFARRVGHATRRLAGKLGRAPEQAEIAAALGLELDALHDRVTKMHATGARGRAAALDDDATEALDEREGPEALCEQRERRAALAAAVARLPARQREVLRMYYDEGRTLRQIAERLGVTESRVSQVHAAAVAKLRSLVEGA